MEEKEEANQDHSHPSLLPFQNTTTIKEESTKKPIGGGCDRVKRDEWSEGAVSTLLEAYEAKWVLRNRAKLKGHDWEEVARHVSSRENFTKSPKTSTQCKNKIESMKKRYRSESATADASSSWPLYSRLDFLLRGTTAPPPTTAVAPPSQPPPSPLANAQNSYGSNGVDKLAKEDGLATKSCDPVSNKNSMDSDSSTPALYSKKDKLRCNKKKTKIENKGRRKAYMEITESLRWLAEAVVRSEQARMDTMKEIERMELKLRPREGKWILRELK